MRANFKTKSEKTLQSPVTTDECSRTSALECSKKRKGSNFYIESWRGSQRISLATDFGLKTSLLATDDADDSAGDGGDVRLGVFSWTHCSTATAKFFSCTDITFARKGWLNRGHHCTITRRVRHTQRVTRC